MGGVFWVKSRRHAGTSVSFCMIARNAGKTLPACLASVQYLADEFIVVDTGSTDDTTNVARSFGAKVIAVRWANDFAAARNVYIHAARCAWVLSLDADELLGPDVDPARVRSGLSENPNTAFVLTVKNYFVMRDWPCPMAPSEYGGEIEPGIGWTPSRTIRLFSQKAGMSYRYPIHESLLPSVSALGMKIRRCDIPILHTGSLTTSATKRSMYRELALLKIAQHPRYSLGYLELALIYIADGDLTKADGMLVKCIGLDPFCLRAYYHWICLALIKGNPSKALRRARFALRVFPKSSDIKYALGLAELGLGNTSGGLASLAPSLKKMSLPLDHWKPSAHKVIATFSG
jgi:glycosyltransferase involved in cell wall biosynthesis